MIYVTGDVHGEFKKFSSSAIKKLRKNAYLIICGDFGFIWNGKREERSLLRKIGKKKFSEWESFPSAECYSPFVRAPILSSA